MLGESEDIILLYNTYIVEYAFTFKFNDTALATLASNSTTLSMYTKHYSILLVSNKSLVNCKSTKYKVS